MEKGTTSCLEESTPELEHLGQWVMLKVQGFIQDLLEEKVEALL